MGFSHIHSWTMSGLLTMPTTGPLQVKPGPEAEPDAGYRSHFSHDTGTATPGYYAVTLDDYNIDVELTSTTRAGFQCYTFQKGGRGRVLLDLHFPAEYGRELTSATVRRAGPREIVGSATYEGYEGVHGSSWQHYTLHFVARTDTPIASMGGWVDDQIQRDTEQVSGQGDVGAFLRFGDLEAGETVRLKTGISLVSVGQARLNLEQEMDPFGWDFAACRADAREQWNKLLGRIEVTGGRPLDQKKFYTNYYRAYCARTIWSDVNGKYVDMNENVQQLSDPNSPIYGGDAFWNTFWNLNQLWNLSTPKYTSQWVRSLLEIYDKGGWLAKGPTGIEYSAIMVASHEIPFIVAAYQHGIRDFDIEKAWKAIEHIQTTPGQAHKGGGYVGNRDLTRYLEHGYVPADVDGQPQRSGQTSNTLEYAYDDWTVAQFAKALNKSQAYQTFSRRAGYWRNVFDTETGFVRPKNSDGSWVTPFDPFDSDGFVEGNAWQYSWFVPQDVPGLVEAMGRERFIKRLNQGMRKSAKLGFNPPRLHDHAFVPVTHGNQPSMQVAYLFDRAGAPWLTQKWTRAIMDKYYGDGPVDGWPGDEDQGQGGAWFVMSAMGLFQLDGGARVNPVYDLGSPLFDRIVINLDGQYYAGEQFVIEARNQSPENNYIQSATLDGEPLNKPWFHASRLQDGGKLVLEMGPEPNKDWGAEMDKVVPSP
jgi:predicted alpha-1,2-mannosidase